MMSSIFEMKIEESICIGKVRQACCNSAHETAGCEHRLFDWILGSKWSDRKDMAE